MTMARTQLQKKGGGQAVDHGSNSPGAQQHLDFEHEVQELQRSAGLPPCCRSITARPLVRLSNIPTSTNRGAGNRLPPVLEEWLV